MAKGLIELEGQGLSYTARSLSKNYRFIVIFLLLASIALLYTQLPLSTPSKTFNYKKSIHGDKNAIQITPDRNITRVGRFAKIAVASGFEDILYERALVTHVQHAKHYGYPMYIGRENAADGMFNKIAFVMNVLLNELFKPAEDRVEWLL
jgi:hypothetical protein